jgi:hypothetical protein
MARNVFAEAEPTLRKNARCLDVRGVFVAEWRGIGV